MKTIHLDVKVTNRPPSEEAHHANSQALAGAIARAVREGLRNGRFVVVDGIVTPSGDQDALSTAIR